MQYIYTSSKPAFSAIKLFMTLKRMISLCITVGMGITTTACSEISGNQAETLPAATLGELSEQPSSGDHVAERDSESKKTPEILSEPTSPGFHNDNTNESVTDSSSIGATITTSELTRLKQDMLNMQVPAVCGHDAGRLNNGFLQSQLGEGNGGTWVGDGMSWVYTGEEPDISTINATTGDLDGKPGDEIALELQCSQGGVGWPSMLAVLDRDLHFIDVLEKFPPEIRIGRSSFEPLRIEDGVVVVSYSALAEGDYEVNPSLTGTSRVALKNGQLVVESSETRPRTD